MKLVDTEGLPFSQLVEGDYYYVDKTGLIVDILDSNPRGVFLYTRPRRFGKTTNITMIDAFFNMKYAGNKWFDGLSISEHPEFEMYRNAFPVIYLNLKDVLPGDKNRDYDYFVGRMRKALSDAFLQFGYLIDSDKVNVRDQKILGQIIDMTVPEVLMVDCLKDLCRMLKEHHGTNTVILIDEYDRAVTDTFDSDLQNQIIGFMGELLSPALKNNENLQMAYITGVMQVAKAGIFSGLNNLSSNNVTSSDSDERFGFTEHEVMEILRYYGRPEMLPEVKSWYDGYRFGNAEVYNPFSVMSYIRRGFKPDRYWSNSGSDVPLRWMLERADGTDMNSVAKIISGGSAPCRIHPDMRYQDLRALKGDDLFSLMVMTGYLKATKQDDGGYSVSIPNREIMSVLDDMLTRNVSLNDELSSGFCRALLDANATAMESVLTEVFDGTNYYDLKDEGDYELVILTMMRSMLNRKYDVTAQRQKGNGRVDLILIPNGPGPVPIVMELKISESQNRLEPDSESAITQIHDRRYYHRMNGTVLLVGIAFWGVVPKVRVERIELRCRPRSK